VVPSERLELAIFTYVESAGKARWRPVDLGTLANVVEFHETAVLVDALLDLAQRRLIEFRQWNYEANTWTPYDGGSRDYFYRPLRPESPFQGGSTLSGCPMILYSSYRLQSSCGPRELGRAQ